MHYIMSFSTMDCHGVIKVYHRHMICNLRISSHALNLLLKSGAKSENLKKLSICQALDCWPTNRERELGSDCLLASVGETSVSGED